MIVIETVPDAMALPGEASLVLRCDRVPCRRAGFAWVRRVPNDLVYVVNLAMAHVRKVHPAEAVEPASEIKEDDSEIGKSVIRSFRRTVPAEDMLKRVRPVGSKVPFGTHGLGNVERGCEGEPLSPQDGGPYGEADRAVLEAEWERVDPEGVAALRRSAARIAVCSDPWCSTARIAVCSDPWCTGGCGDPCAGGCSDPAAHAEGGHDV
jgi:hypothetical protein